MVAVVSLFLLLSHLSVMSGCPFVQSVGLCIYFLFYLSFLLVTYTVVSLVFVGVDRVLIVTFSQSPARIARFALNKLGVLLFRVTIMHSYQVLTLYGSIRSPEINSFIHSCCASSEKTFLVHATGKENELVNEGLLTWRLYTRYLEAVYLNKKNNISVL